MADMAVVVEIVGRETVSPAASTATHALAGLEQQGGRTNAMFSTLATVGAAAFVTAVAAVGAGLVKAIKSTADFEKEISAIGAVTGASGDQIKQLSDLALQLGKDTSFSASQSAQGIEALAKAGVSLADIMGGAAAASLNLAAAGGVSVGDAAEIASNAMNVFNIKGADMAHIADEIAGAANASAIDVNDYKFSLAAAGAVAATVGVSFDDLSTAIAVMGQAGIKGSDAGTSLKTLLLNLTPSTKSAAAEMKALGIITADGANQFFDASGKVKSMAEIAGVLQRATAGLTEQQRLQALQTLFGTDAIRAAAIMAKNGAAGFNEMAGAIGNVSAADVANTRLNNLAGSIEKFTGSAETAAILIGQHLTPGLKSIVDVATDLLNNALPGITATMDAFGALFAVLGSTGGVERARVALNNLFPPEVSHAILGALADIGDLFTQTFTVNIPGVIDAGERILTNFGTVISGLVESWAHDFAAWVDGADSGMMDNLAVMAINLLAWFIRTDIAIVEKLALWAGEFLDWIGPKIPGMLEALGRYGAAMWGWMLGTALPTIAEKLAEWGLAFVEWVAPRIPPLLLALGGLLLELGGWIITTALPAIVGKIAEWGLAFVKWVPGAVVSLLFELGKLEFEFLGWIAQETISIGKAALDLGGGFVGGIRDGIDGSLDGFWSWLQSSFVDKIPSFVRDLLNIHSPSGVFFDIGTNIVAGLQQGMESRLPSIDQVVQRLVGRLSTAGNVDDWLKAAIAVTGVGEDWLSGLRRLVDAESSGNPNAVNPVDVGNGEHAAGLLQTIPSTFEHYRVDELPDDIFNPVSNAAAAIRYIQRTYGSVYDTPLFTSGGEYPGYATGGIAWGKQLAWVGENEPEVIAPLSQIRPRMSSGGQDGGIDRDALAKAIARELAGVLPRGGHSITVNGSDKNETADEVMRRLRREDLLTGVRR